MGGCLALAMGYYRPDAAYALRQRASARELGEPEMIEAEAAKGAIYMLLAH